MDVVTPGYREFAPGPALAGPVQCVWVGVVPPAGGQPTLVLPDGCTDLIWQSGAGAFVAGPDTGPVPDARPGGAVLVGVRFRPGAGGAALGLPLSELLDRRVDAGDLPALPRGRLPAELAPEQALQRLAGLAADLVTERPGDRLVIEAARLLDRPGARVEEVAGTLGIGERQLRRRFQAAVGYGPRMLHRVLRFRRFLDRVDAAQGPAGLAELAAVTGYADQAHLTRESTSLAGLPPAALAGARQVQPGPPAAERSR